MSNRNISILLVSGPLSVVSSSIIIVMILRSNVKLSNRYHRLMFGMSLTDMLFSSALSFGSLPAPINEPNVWIAIGTRSTCNLQGFFVAFGIASFFYFLSLQIYYLLMIKYHTKKTLLKKLEPYLHIVPISIGLLSGCLALITDSINPGSRGYCWPQDFPLHCTGDENVECIRGKNALKQRIFLLAWPVILIWTLNCTIMWAIYSTLRKQDRRNASHSFQPSRTSTPPRRRSFTTFTADESHNLQYQRSRKARTRVLQYFIAFSLTMGFVTLDMLLCNVKSLDNLMEILTLISQPLAGFFNLIVFIIPTVNNVRRVNPEFSLFRACGTAIISYAGPGSGDTQSRRQARRASNTLRHQVEVAANIVARSYNTSDENVSENSG
mmetsp:Transcript_25114/g.28940  ORF Transcript_25114/g.28940 Transcript_25114/m.28940 type:complete len:381 (-) Transcript_25114:604-1746(-)